MQSGAVFGLPLQNERIPGPLQEASFAKGVYFTGLLRVSLIVSEPTRVLGLSFVRHERYLEERLFLNNIPITVLFVRIASLRMKRKKQC